MNVSWSPEQIEIIHSRNGDLLVSAAAGSGKTAVLIEHILSRITDPQDPADISEFMVSTFTRNAAYEMRERLTQSLDEILEKDPENVRIRRQKALLPHAQISTIDSFCIRLVRSHFSELAVDPDFRIGEEGELELIRAEVLDRILKEEFEAADPSFRFLLDNYSNHKGDRALREYIRRLDRTADSAADPEGWLAWAREGLDPDVQLADESSPVRGMIRSIRYEIAEISQSMRQALNTLRSEACPDPSKYLNMLETDLEVLERLLRLSGDETFLQELSLLKLTGKPRVLKDQMTPAESAVSELRDAYKAQLETYQTITEGGFERLRETMSILRDPLRKLIDLTIRFRQEVDAEKQRKNVKDFSETAHLALKLLRENEAVRRQVSAAFREVITDEYQDCNAVQEDLMQLISGHGEGLCNRFMVGDIKQSIYGFRLAKPDFFREKYEQYSYGEGDRKKRDLNRNYRSRRPVLNTVNAVFSKLMRREISGVDYDKNQLLRYGEGYPEPDETPYRSELILVDRTESSQSGRQAEAQAIARRIRELTDPETGLMVRDGKTKQMRRARLSDIVILLRTVEDWADLFTSTLIEAGIPAVSQVRKGYFAVPEVRLLLALLRIIDNHRQDIPLTAVLVSVIGGFTNEELARLRTKEKKKAFCDLVLESEEPRLAAFREKLDGYRKQSRYLPIHELLDRIFEETGYLLYLQALPGGTIRRANAEMLREKALAFEQTSYTGLFQFIRYIEKLQAYSVDFGEAATLAEDEDLVRVMSIHKSKGLEFPVVFVSGLSKSFNKSDQKSPVVLHDELGIAADLRDLSAQTTERTLLKQAISRQSVRDAQGEEIRLLYVAMTRAKEKLILTGSVKKDADELLVPGIRALWEGPVPVWQLMKVQTYLDLLLAAGSVTDGSFDLQVVHPEELAGSEKVLTADYAARRKAVEEAGAGRIYDPEFRAALERAAGFVYPYQSVIRQKGAYSVSDLKHAAMEDEDYEAPGSENFGGAELGSAYHAVFEALDLAAGAGEETVRSCIGKLTERGQITPETAEKIDPSVMTAFLMSPLGKRASEADRQGRLHKEHRFLLGVPLREAQQEADSDETAVVQGIIDLYFEEPDGLVLVDYKTDRIRPGDEDVLVRRYRKQLEIYRRALEAFYRKPVKETVLYSLFLNEAIEVGEKKKKKKTSCPWVFWRCGRLPEASGGCATVWQRTAGKMKQGFPA